MGCGGVGGSSVLLLGGGATLATRGLSPGVLSRGSSLCPPTGELSLCLLIMTGLNPSGDGELVLMSGVGLREMELVPMDGNEPVLPVKWIPLSNCKLSSDSVSLATQ